MCTAYKVAQDASWSDSAILAVIVAEMAKLPSRLIRQTRRGRADARPELADHVVGIPAVLAPEQIGPFLAGEMDKFGPYKVDLEFKETASFLNKPPDQGRFLKCHCAWLRSRWSPQGSAR